MRMAWWGAVALGTCVLVAGCGSKREDEAMAVTQRFYSAVADHDGRPACEQLGDAAVSKLESEEEAPCAKAVLTLKLSGVGADKAAVYVTAAQVSLVGADTVFLDQGPDGWSISA